MSYFSISEVKLSTTSSPRPGVVGVDVGIVNVAGSISIAVVVPVVAATTATVV